VVHRAIDAPDRVGDAPDHHVDTRDRAGDASDHPTGARDHHRGPRCSARGPRRRPRGRPDRITIPSDHPRGRTDLALGSLDRHHAPRVPMPGADDRDDDEEDRDRGSGDRLPDGAEDHGDTDDEAPDSDPDPPVEPEVPLEGEDPSAPRIDRAIVVRFLGSRDALRIAARAVRRMVPAQIVEDLAAEAIGRALTAPAPRSEKALPAWLTTIARRRAIGWLEKRKRRSKFEGPMPERRSTEDAYTGEVVDADLEPGELAYDPDADTGLSRLLGSSLDHYIGDDAFDRETRDIIRESATTRKTYKQIALERNTTEVAIKKRISRFKRKYAERVRRRDMLMLWLKIGGGAVVLAVAAVIAYLLLRRPPEELIGPDPDMLRPAPSASVTGPDIARPTQPSASASTPPPEPAPPPEGPKPGQK
jgi:DNA-directed RNA polymerase specialized sigma24 family protein